MARAQGQPGGRARSGGPAHEHERRRLSLPEGVATPEETIPGVSAAAAEVAAALRNGERIAIFCDYDPDGTCAGEVLRLALAGHAAGVSYDPAQPRQLLFGYATAAKGFGLDLDFVTSAAAAGATMLITVDCGSASSAAVARAQALGLRVIVTDHHQISADNTADYHLNPALHGPSNASGSVVAYKLALALAEQLDGGPTPLLLGRGAVVAAFGARSDWMEMNDRENAALAALGADPANIPPGLTYLATCCGHEHIADAFPELDALLNLPKRTPRAQARWSAQLLAAASAQEAAEPAAQLLALGELSERVLADMLEAAKLSVHTDDVRVGYASLRVPGCDDFTGHAGNVAYELSLTHERPVIVFIYAGEDAFGNELWRWAARQSEGPNTGHSFTERLGAIREASTLMGVAGPSPSAGGHPRAVSGKCTGDRVMAVVAAFESWAQSYSDWQTPAA